MKVYVYLYNSYITDDFELTTHKEYAKSFTTKKEINYYLKVLKLNKYDVKIID